MVYLVQAIREDIIKILGRCSLSDCPVEPHENFHDVSYIILRVNNKEMRWGKFRNFVPAQFPARGVLQGHRRSGRGRGDGGRVGQRRRRQEGRLRRGVRTAAVGKKSKI